LKVTPKKGKSNEKYYDELCKQYRDAESYGTNWIPNQNLKESRAMKITEINKMDKLMEMVREGFTEKEFDYAGPIQEGKIQNKARRWLLKMNEFKSAQSLRRCIHINKDKAREIYKEMVRIERECENLENLSVGKRYYEMRKYLLELRKDEVFDFEITKANKWNL